MRIVLYETRTANRTDCATRLNKDSGRLQCFGNSTAHLRIWEVSSLDDTPPKRELQNECTSWLVKRVVLKTVIVFKSLDNGLFVVVE